MVMTRKPLFLQGTSAAPVLHPAEDTRLNMGAFWTPDGASSPVAVRSGIVWGPGDASYPTPMAVTTPAAATVQIARGRAVIQGGAALSGAYVVTVDATQTRTIPGASLPGAGQFKAGYVIVHVYDTVYGDTQDAWDIEITLGAAASSTNAAVYPVPPSNSLVLRTLTVDSSGNITLAGWPTYTAPNGDPFPVTDATARAAIASPYNGMTCWELSTKRVFTYSGPSFRWVYTGGGLAPRCRMNLLTATPPASTDFSCANALPSAALWDTDGIYDGVNKRLVIPTGWDGMWRISLLANTNGAGNTAYWFFRLINGAAQTTPPTNVLQSEGITGQEVNAYLVYEGLLTAGQVLTFQMWTNQASPGYGGANFGAGSYLQAEWLAPTAA